MLAVEQFFAALVINGAEVPAAIQALPPEARAQLATDLNTDEANLDMAIYEIIDESDSNAVYVRNTPVTSRSRGMSNTLGISVSELADLSADGNTICLCKGTEATYFLQAFTGDFVELVGDEAVNDFLLDESAVAGEKHQITRQALAGQALDTRFQNRLEQVGKNAYEAVRSLGRTTASEFERTRDNLASATADVLASGSEVQQADLSPDEGG